MVRFNTIKRSFDRKRRVLTFRCHNARVISRVYH